MKVCSQCFRLYEPSAGFCPVDGQQLADVSAVAKPSDPEDSRIGNPVCNGRYVIYRKVADGGMGRVYQGLDLQQNRTVALKILHPEVAVDPVAVERFKREFEVSSGLPHDHIVDVLAFEQTEDNTFALVMEYLEGEELRMLLKREKAIPPERVIRMMSQVAIGLSAAHDRKVVHRDLKPDNVFLCHTSEGDIVKILDFGSVRDNNENAKKLTVMGTTIGSPFYMAPEQAQGLPTLDHRADVWSLAAIGYECLTGSVPFRGATGPAILLAILTQEPVPPSEVRVHQKVPITLDLVMEEALTKDPDIRIRTIGELVDRIGAAFGLSGNHVAWAKTPQEQLRQGIEAGIQQALAAHNERYGPAMNLGAMDAAMQGPAPHAPAGPVGHAAAPQGQFSEDLVMGVPDSGVPKWLIPTVAGACVVVGAIVAFFVLR